MHWNLVLNTHQHGITHGSNEKECEISILKHMPTVGKDICLAHVPAWGVVGPVLEIVGI